MTRPKPSTLIDALASLPASVERGFRFRGLDATDRFFQWREVEREARRRGALLLDSGLAKGDRLALVIAEPHEFVLTFLGAVVAGIVPVPMYPRASFKAKNAYVDTVSHIVQAAGARVLATLEGTRDVAEEVLGRGTGLEKIIMAEEFSAPIAAPRAIRPGPASLPPTCAFCSSPPAAPRCPRA